MITTQIYNLLCDLSFPKASESLKHNEIADLLHKTLNSAPNKICKRIKFGKCYQSENELIQDFSARLKQIKTYCEFSEDTLNLFEKCLSCFKKK